MMVILLILISIFLWGRLVNMVVCDGSMLLVVCVVMKVLYVLFMIGKFLCFVR